MQSAGYTAAFSPYRGLLLIAALASALGGVAPAAVAHGTRDARRSRPVLRLRSPVTLGAGPVLQHRFGPTLHAPAVAVNAHGAAAVSWQNQSEGVESAVGSATTNRWQQPVSLTAEGDTNGENVAIDQRGHALVGWQMERAGAATAEYAFGNATTGVWQSPFTLAEESAQLEGPYAVPSVAFDAHGDGFAVWATRTTIQASYMPVATRVWQSPTTISPDGQTIQNPSIAIDSQGNVVAVWVREFQVANFQGVSVVEAATRPAATGIWRTAVNLVNVNEATRYGHEAISVAVGPHGNAVVSWIAYHVNGSFVPQSLDVTLGSIASNAWQRPKRITAVNEGGGELSRPAIAVDRGDRAVVLWEREAQGSVKVEATVRSLASGRWPAPTILHSEATRGPSCILGRSSPTIAFDGHDNAVAVWSPWCHAPFADELPARSDRWRKPASLSMLTGNSPGMISTAVSAQGDVVAAWFESASNGHTSTTVKTGVFRFAY